MDTRFDLMHRLVVDRRVRFADDAARHRIGRRNLPRTRR
jgi:hypothetical protein